MSLQEYIHWLLAIMAVTLPYDHWVFRLIEDSSKHFLLAFAVGFLGYFLTSIILYVPYWTMLRLNLIKEYTAVVYIIIFISMLVLISLVLLSHWGLDYLSYLWQLPLGEPLQLK